jgi:hypothetical protein
VADSSFAPRQFLLPLARQLNRIPLPTFSQSYTHILLPPPGQMLGHVNFNLVPNRLPETSEGLYEGFEDDEEDGWGSEDDESQEADEDEQVQEPNTAMTVGEEDGDDIDAMDVVDTAPTNGIEGRGQKRSLEDTEL